MLVSFVDLICLYLSERNKDADFKSQFLALSWVLLFLRIFFSILLCHLLHSVDGMSMQIPEASEHTAEDDDDEENLMMESIKGKCITQLLLLGVIDSIQVKMHIKIRFHFALFVGCLV